MFFLYLILVDSCQIIWKMWPWKYPHDLKNRSVPKNRVFCCNYGFFKDNLIRFGHNEAKTYPFRTFSSQISLFFSSTSTSGSNCVIFEEVFFFQNFNNCEDVLTWMLYEDALRANDLHLTLTLFQGQTLKSLKNLEFCM